MTAANLIPMAVRLRQTRKRKIRRWLVVSVSATILGGASMAHELVQDRRLDELQGRQLALADELSSTGLALQDAVMETRDFADQIVRADALRTKRSWDDLLTMIGLAMPDRVWLSTIETVRLNGASSSNRGHLSALVETTNRIERPDVVLEGPRRLQIVGYALDHADLYAFMAELKARGSFVDVELTKSGNEPVLRGSAVRFVLDCRW